MNVDVARAIGSGWTRRTLSSTSRREVIKEQWVSEPYAVDDLLTWLDGNLTCAWEADGRDRCVGFGEWTAGGGFEHQFHCDTLLEALEQAVLAVSS